MSDAELVDTEATQLEERARVELARVHEDYIAWLQKKALEAEQLAEQVAHLEHLEAQNELLRRDQAKLDRFRRIIRRVPLLGAITRRF